MSVGGRPLLAFAVVATALAAVAGPAAGAGDKRATPRVTVGDDYFAPDAVKIAKGGKVKWVWDPMNTDTHNVVLTGRHPDGVKRNDYRSQSGAVGITYAPRFKVPGTYEFVCTYHKSVMRMTVKVKK